MIMGNRIVSVLIPTYNSGAVIARCLESVRNQSYSAVEVIVIDNCSHDFTASVAEDFGAKVVRCKSTPAAARNVGLANSVGKYVLFIDSDQVLSKHLVEECVSRCEEKDAAMVRIPELFIGDGFWGLCLAQWKNNYVEVEKKYEERGDLLSGEPRFFVKERVVRVGMLDPDLLWGEDYDLHERLKELGARETSCNSLLYHFESASAKEILAKSLRYGESLQTFTHRSQRHVYSRLIRHSLLTWERTLAEVGEAPSIALGCTFLLGLRTFAMAAGLLISLM